MHLPAEIVSIICCSFKKSEIKNARLTCRLWSQALVPLLFDEVFLSTNRADFAIAHETIQRFQPSIKTLIFSSVVYEMIWLAEFKDETKKQCSSVRPSRGQAQWRDQHIRYTYDNYCALQKQQREDFGTGVFLAYLCRALKSLPNLQRIIITDGGTLTGDQMRGRGLWVLQTPCPVPACTLSDSGHLEYQLDPISGFRTSLANPCDLVTLAIWTTNRIVKEVAIEPRKFEDSPGTSLFSQNSDIMRPFAMRTYLEHLVKLRLTLMCDEPDGNLQNKTVAQALSGATNLQSLYLELRDFESPDKFYTPPTSRFLGCFEGCKFVELRSLILSGFYSTVPELLSFLGNSPQLQQLTLNEHRLHQRRWATAWAIAADQMRQLGNLKDVELNNLRGILFDNYLEELDGIYQDHYGNVEAFFFDHGPNPFTKKAIQRFYEDLKNDRPWKYREGGLGPEARYRLFH